MTYLNGELSYKTNKRGQRRITCLKRAESLGRYLHIWSYGLNYGNSSFWALPYLQCFFPLSISWNHPLRPFPFQLASSCLFYTHYQQLPEASSIHFDFGLSAPYLDLPLLRSGIPSKSLTPRIRWDFTPGESFTLPPLTKTIECSCKL